MNIFKHTPSGASQSHYVFIHSSELDGDGYPEHCPFNTTRAGQTRKAVKRMGLLHGSDRRVVAPKPLTEDELAWLHTSDYLEALRQAQQGRHTIEALKMGLGSPDCPIFPGMYDYVRLAAGGTLTGARVILNAEANVAFNPSGGFHHAHAGAASGFCYVNDIVIGAEALLRAGKRVVFLDIDVHHCDGVQDAFYERDDIMTLSMHESGKTLFPGTGFEDEMGARAGRGYTVNLPLPVGTYDEAYLRAFNETVLPLMKAFAPDVIIVELGMDALAGDPLAHLHLTNNAPAEILGHLLTFKRPILATGGGGYNIENTVRGWALCWSVLCGDQFLNDSMSLGLGGVMLENTDWSGGLRDRVLLSDAGRRGHVDAEINATIERIKASHFPIHGM